MNIITLLVKKCHYSGQPHIILYLVPEYWQNISTLCPMCLPRTLRGMGIPISLQTNVSSPYSTSYSYSTCVMFVAMHWVIIRSGNVLTHLWCLVPGIIGTNGDLLLNVPFSEIWIKIHEVSYKKAIEYVGCNMTAISFRLQCVDVICDPFY